MRTVTFSPFYSAFLDYLVEKASPHEILGFRLPDEARERAAELTERNNAGLITPEEAVELDQMLELEQMVGLLKAKAFEALHRL